MDPIRTAEYNVGDKGGRPRIYLEGKYLKRAGFRPGMTLNVDADGPNIVVSPTQTQTRQSVSKKRRKRAGRRVTIPVIDLNKRRLGEVVKTDETVEVVTEEGRITIRPRRVRRLVVRRQYDATCGEAFAGGGTLAYAAHQAGYSPEWAVESNEDYAGVYRKNFPDARVLAQPIQQVDPAFFTQVELFMAGVPCQPFSKAIGQERRQSHDLRFMTFWALRAVEACNPASVIIEEVPRYLGNDGTDGEMARMLVSVLREMGYDVWKAVVNPRDYGGITGRKRSVVIGHTNGYCPPVPCKNQTRLGDYLDEDAADRWFHLDDKTWLKDHWERHERRGNGFGRNTYTAEDQKVGTIKKRYFAQQGDNPILKHPEKDEVFRWFTLNEVKRFHGLEGFQLPLKSNGTRHKTLSGEVLGQGVEANVFEKIIGGLKRPDASFPLHDRGE